MTVIVYTLQCHNNILCMHNNSFIDIPRPSQRPGGEASIIITSKLDNYVQCMSFIINYPTPVAIRICMYSHDQIYMP